MPKKTALSKLIAKLLKEGYKVDIEVKQPTTVEPHSFEFPDVPPLDIPPLDLPAYEFNTIPPFNPTALPDMLEAFNNIGKHADLNKFDQGKLMGGVLQDFLPALKEVAELGSMNNKPQGKYDRGSWLQVENADVRYLDAFWRHQLDGMYNVDKTTGKIHLIAMTWNLLALLTFYLRSQDNAGK